MIFWNCGVCSRVFEMRVSKKSYTTGRIHLLYRICGRDSNPRDGFRAGFTRLKFSSGQNERHFHSPRENAERFWILLAGTMFFPARSYV